MRIRILQVENGWQVEITGQRTVLSKIFTTRKQAELYAEGGRGGAIVSMSIMEGTSMIYLWQRLTRMEKLTWAIAGIGVAAAIVSLWINCLWVPR